VVFEIAVRGGVIQTQTYSDRSIIIQEDEILCHWRGWMDDKTHQSGLEPELISIVKRLLIGSPDSNASKISKRPIILCF